MSNLLHPKFHRRNHHTYGNPSNPDAGHDPIASPESPFLGDFVLAGALSAYAPLSATAGYFYSNLTALKVESPGVALYAKGNIVIDGNLTVNGSSTCITCCGGGGGSVSTPVTLCSISCGINIVGCGIGLNINPSTLTYDTGGNLTVNVACLPLSSNNVQVPQYNFSKGLSRQIISANSISVSANVDSNTIRINSFDQLSTNSFVFTNGLSCSTNINYVTTVGANIDNSTLKINNGVLQSGYSFTNAITSNGNILGLATDDKTVKIVNNKLTSGYQFLSGGALNLDDSTQQIKVNVDNSTVKIDPTTNSLKAFGFVSKTDSTPQGVTSSLSVSGVFAPTKGIVFSDGSFLNSTTNLIRPYVTGLAKLKYNYYSAIVSTSDSRLIAWGANDHFAWNGHDMWPPQSLKFNGDYNLKNNVSVVKVIHSQYATGALLSDGTLWVSGYNNWGASGGQQYGQLGTQTDSSAMANFRLWTLYQVIGWSTGGDHFITDFELASSYSSGQVNLAAIDSQGTVFTWGANRYGSLGHSYDTENIEYYPKVVLGPASLFTAGAKQVMVYFNSNDTSSTLILTKDGYVYGAGWQGYGSFGQGVDNVDRYRSFTQLLKGSGQPVSGISKIVNNNTSNTFSHFLLGNDKTIWVAGRNGEGALGLGNTTHTSDSGSIYFKQITTATSGAFPKVNDVGISGAEGSCSLAAIAENGDVYTWGYNGYGQLGLGDTTNRSRPTLVPGLKGSQVVGCSCGNGSNMLGIIGTDGFLYLAGRYATSNPNTYNASNTRFQSVPVPNVVEAQLSSDRASTTGVVIRDKYNRVFVLCSDPSSYFSGPTNLRVAVPFEITNSLV